VAKQLRDIIEGPEWGVESATAYKSMTPGQENAQNVPYKSENDSVSFDIQKVIDAVNKKLSGNYALNPKKVNESTPLLKQLKGNFEKQDKPNKFGVTQTEYNDKKIYSRKSNSTTKPGKTYTTHIVKFTGQGKGKVYHGNRELKKNLGKKLHEVYKNIDGTLKEIKNEIQ
jgi:hypothetical protein